MKYSDLPTIETLAKLKATSFDNPEINLWAYKLYKVLSEPIGFVEQERNKNVVALGEKQQDGSYRVKPENIECFYAKMQEIFDMEIAYDIPYFPIKESDFDAEHCCYPKQKEMWLNGNDIDSLLDFIKKIQKEKEAD